MSKKTVVPVEGIDLEFRPLTYFSAAGPPLLATIKGTERRAALGRLIAAEDPREIPDFLLRPALSNDDRRAIGGIHPAFMSGEYLPDSEANEVEIARITIASSTYDVTSVRARPRKDRIFYRVVDEYDGQTLGEKTVRTSKRPLTLAELETFFVAAWPLFDLVLELNFEGRYDAEEMLAFVQKVESQFYPDIDALFRFRIRQWAEERRRGEGVGGQEDAIDIDA